MNIRHVVIVLVTAVLLISLAGCGNKNEQTASKTSNTPVQKSSNLSPAYQFSLTTLDGKKVDLNDYKGKVLILDFWDTWCPPCKAEIPHFIELYDQYNDQGLEILGVAFGREGIPAVKNFISSYGIQYSNAIGNQQIVSGFGGFNSIPTTFVINQDGRIYKRYTGYRDKGVFEADILALLNS